VANTEPCDDEDVCTTNDVCSDGACGGESICDDGKPCTDDVCDGVGGCTHPLRTGPCDDGNPCSENDECKSGQCIGAKVVCDDGDPCTVDWCDPVIGCGADFQGRVSNEILVHDDFQGGFDPGKWTAQDMPVPVILADAEDREGVFHITSTLDRGLVSKALLPCNAGFTIEADFYLGASGDELSPGMADVHLALARRVDGSVEDGEHAVRLEIGRKYLEGKGLHYSLGARVHGKSVYWNNWNSVLPLVDGWHTLTIRVDPDHVVTFYFDHVQLGTNAQLAAANASGYPIYLGGFNNMTGSVAYVDWVMVKLGTESTPCGDGCDDGTGCTLGSCNEGWECTNAPLDAGTPCADDGLPCTADQCDGGTSCMHPPLVSGTPCEDDGLPCTADHCDGGADCVHPLLMDGTPCEIGDGDVCVLESACLESTCLPTSLQECDDGEPCTVDYCDPDVGCDSYPIAGPCDDGDVCTVDEACSAGVCSGDAVDCDDGDPCTVDSCDPVSGCAHEPVEPPCP
jgi:hypothetical protein